MRSVVRQPLLLSTCWPSVLWEAALGQQRWQSSNPGSSSFTDSYSVVQERQRSGRTSTIVITGSPSQGFTFSHSEGRKRVVETTQSTPSRGVLHNVWRKCVRLAKATLMPAGYPNSVNPGFAAYAAWQGVTNLACQANMVIASTFLLYAVGLSAGTAIATAGALNWVLKDGLGQLGTLVLGKIVAHNFDVHSKSWFFISTAMLTTAIGLEIGTILIPQHFLILGSLAGMIKGLAFMASSSTRSVFNLAFTKDNNIADVTAKSTSQWICASLFGTLVGSTVCTWVGQDSISAGACYLALSAITLYAALQSVKTIPLATLNSTRLQLLCECFLSAAASASRQARAGELSASTSSSSSSSMGPTLSLDSGSSSSHSQPLLPPPHSSSKGTSLFRSALTERQIARDLDLDDDVDDLPPLPPPKPKVPKVWSPDPMQPSESETLYDEYQDARVPNPADLATEDPPLPFVMGDQRLLNPAVLVGEPLERMFEDVGPELVVLLLTTYRLSRVIVLPRGPAVHILLHQEATAKDICQAYIQACLLRRRMRAGSTVGLVVAQHALEVQAAALERAREEANAAAVAAAAWSRSSADLAGDAASGAGGPPPAAAAAAGGGLGPPEDEDLVCVVRGRTSPALADLRIVLQDTLQTSERLVGPFMRSLQTAGWRLEKIVVEADKRRATW